jgi:hypothetical protein
MPSMLWQSDAKTLVISNNVITFSIRQEIYLYADTMAARRVELQY